MTVSLNRVTHYADGSPCFSLLSLNFHLLLRVSFQCKWQHKDSFVQLKLLEKLDTLKFGDLHSSWEIIGL
jgi:hypothetical protein